MWQKIKERLEKARLALSGALNKGWTITKSGGSKMWGKIKEYLAKARLALSKALNKSRPIINRWRMKMWEQIKKWAVARQKTVRANLRKARKAAIRAILVAIVIGGIVLAFSDDERLAHIGLRITLSAIAFGLFIANILLLASYGWYFAKVPESSIVTIDVADKMDDIWPNVGGTELSDELDPQNRNWLIMEEDPEKRLRSFFKNALFGTAWFQRWLWEELGVRFIGFTYPNKHVHLINIRSKLKIRERTPDDDNKPLLTFVENSAATPEDAVVSELRWMIPHPIYMEGVDLPGDSSKVNLLFEATFQVVIPRTPVYELKGDFFVPIDTAVKAAIIDALAVQTFIGKDEKGNPMGELPLTYYEWLKAPKGYSSILESRLKWLNVSGGYFNALPTSLQKFLVAAHLVPKSMRPRDDSETPPQGEVLEAEVLGPDEIEMRDRMGMGMIGRFGIALTSLRLYDWEPHKDTKALDASIRARETERHLADALREKSYGIRDADISEAEGTAAKYGLPVKALTALQVDPNVAAGVLGRDLGTKNIAGVGTYVEGGANTLLSVSASPAQPKALPKPETAAEQENT